MSEMKTIPGNTETLLRFAAEGLVGHQKISSLSLSSIRTFMSERFDELTKKPDPEKTNFHQRSFEDRRRNSPGYKIEIVRISEWLRIYREAQTSSD